MSSHALIGMVLGGLAVAGLGGVAHAQERCSGTLCDLWYRNAPAATEDTTAKPSAPTPVTVPSGNMFTNWFSRGSSSGTAAAGQTAATAPAEPPLTTKEADASSTNSYMHMGGGGILNWGSNQRCSGTLCDTFYGGPPAEQQGGTQPTRAPSATAAASSGATQPSGTTVALTEEQRRFVSGSVEVARPHCSGGDPWHCYRK